MGKTSTFRYFPGKTLVLDVDRTSDVLRDCASIDILKIDNVKTWDDWQRVIMELYQNYRGQYDNICVDNISELERCILSDLGSQGKNMGVPAQGDYQKMQFRLVNSLRYMKNMDCNIIWTAWERSLRFMIRLSRWREMMFISPSTEISRLDCTICWSSIWQESSVRRLRSAQR